MTFVHGKVLDIGCGARKRSLHLQEQGFSVMRMDESLLAIKFRKKRGLKKALNLSISEIHKLNDHSFDTILMPGNNFGLFGSFKKAKTLLRKMSSITKTQARIIVESNDLYQTDLPENLEYHKLNIVRNCMSGQLRIRIRFRKYIGKWFDSLLVSKIRNGNNFRKYWVANNPIS